MYTQQLSDSVVINAAATTLYDMVSDVTRMGEWSPQCRACWWDPGQGPEVGAHFTGHNETPDRTWETRSQVVVADPGQEFAWVVEGCVRWGYSIESIDSPLGQTRLTESWHLFNEGITQLREKYGDTADEEIADRAAAAESGIPATLSAMKATAEAD